MSVQVAKQAETYKGNLIRILDAEGKLVRVLTIDEFLEERKDTNPHPGMPGALVAAKRGRAIASRNRFTAPGRRRADVFRVKSDDPDAPQDHLDTPAVSIDGFDDISDTRRYDRSLKEEL